MHLILYCDTTATYILKLVFNVVQIGFKLIASMYMNLPMPHQYNTGIANQTNYNSIIINRTEQYKIAFYKLT